MSGNCWEARGDLKYIKIKDANNLLQMEKAQKPKILLKNREE